jgi:hypothetical protein
MNNEELFNLKSTRAHEHTSTRTHEHTSTRAHEHTSTRAHELHPADSDLGFFEFFVV